MISPVKSVPSGVSTKMKALRATLDKDWDSGVVPIAMMGLQAQTVVGSMVGLIQSVYLVQFGARAAIISNYLTLALPINLVTSCAAVALLVGVSIRYSWLLYVLGCCTSLAASIALTFPPQLFAGAEQQSRFLSHYFGTLFVIANVGAKFRDYPNGIAKVYLLHGTQSRASEKAYSTIFDVMVGNGLNGALMLTMLANPTTPIKVCLALLQVASTAVSLRGAFILRQLRDLGQDGPPSASPAEANMVIGSPSEVQENDGNSDPVVERLDVKSPPPPSTRGGRQMFLYALTLATNAQVWQLILIEWCVGFIFMLNSQAAGTIYWSSVVGVTDDMRSVYIALESALGGGVLGFVATLYVTRLYHSPADVSVIIPRIVASGAAMGGVVLLLFGSSSIGSLLGITSLYLYYFVFPWSSIEFLKLLDTLKAKHPGGNPLLYMFLIKDIAGGFLGNLRNMALMWLLASTGFYEPDCNAQCETSTAAECVAQCHAEAHASITAGTVTLVRVLYVGVTPGAYILACMMIRMYSALEPHDFHKKQSSSDLG
mmetsp:Transcript_97261/g.313526  ORF Transcript_97261/g.313526 Transcript_97261/m.313526 type:complete len:542 (-) Transcript_97261:780-2405(-)